MRRILGPGDTLVITSILDRDEKVDATWTGEVRLAGVHVAWADYTFDNLQPGGRRRLTVRLRLTEDTEASIE